MKNVKLEQMEELDAKIEKINYDLSGLESRKKEMENSKFDKQQNIEKLEEEKRTILAKTDKMNRLEKIIYIAFASKNDLKQVDLLNAKITELRNEKDSIQGKIDIQNKLYADTIKDKVTRRNNDPESNSGYTEDLDKDTNGSESTPIENTYSNLQEYYVSQSGHTRLFTATKYCKRYVLKCLKKDFLYTPVYQQALTKEFEIGLELEHPNICRTLSLEQLPELGTTIVMEHIDGETLKSLINIQVIHLKLQ